VARREAVAGDVDVVVPVPLHRQRELERGYHQADLIALSRWPASWAYLTEPSCWYEPSHARISISSAWRSAGTRYVALLPRVRAAKLTRYAYCW
jgi:hypothetical protein